MKIFSVMTLRPPRSTLFAYTTLFRSLELVIEHEPGGGVGAPKVGHFSRQRRRAGGADEADQNRDRKSTRLNSSHVKISYAVFCLKKHISASLLTLVESFNAHHTTFQV